MAKEAWSSSQRFWRLTSKRDNRELFAKHFLLFFDPVFFLTFAIKMQMFQESVWKTLFDTTKIIHFIDLQLGGVLKLQSWNLYEPLWTTIKSWKIYRNFRLKSPMTLGEHFQALALRLELEAPPLEEAQLTRWTVDGSHVDIIPTPPKNDEHCHSWYHLRKLWITRIHG